MEIGVWFGILLSAVLAFLLGDFYGQPLHLFILMIVIGFFINTIILIVRVKDENS